MHGHAGVAQHGLGPGGGDDDLAGAVFQRIGEAPVMAVHLALLDLEVGNGGLEVRVPVHQPLVAVDQPRLVQIDEHLAHGARQALVQGKALAAPVARGAQAAELAGDGAARLRLPRPDALDEGLAAHVAATDTALGGQLALHHHLGGDAGVVGAGQPQHRLALHAVIAGEDVLQGVVQRVADVQRTGDVRRRDHHAERRGAGVAAEDVLRAKYARTLPGGVQARFNGLWVEGLVEHGFARKSARAGAWQAKNLRSHVIPQSDAAARAQTATRATETTGPPNLGRSFLDSGQPQ